jgi:hypothetical protein
MPSGFSIRHVLFAGSIGTPTIPAGFYKCETEPLA